MTVLKKTQARESPFASSTSSNINRHVCEAFTSLDWHSTHDGVRAGASFDYTCHFVARGAEGPELAEGVNSGS